MRYDTLYGSSGVKGLSTGFCVNLHNEQPITNTHCAATVTFHLVMKSITANASSQSVSLSVTADGSCRSYCWTAMWWSVSRNFTETALRKMPNNGEVERRRNFVNILRFARGGTVVAVRLPRSRYVADRRDIMCPLFRCIIVRAIGTIKQYFRTEIQ